MTTATDQPKTRPRSLLKPDSFEILSLLAVLVLVGYQLFVPPIIGIADNGDFGRFLERVGLDRVPGEYSDKYFLYVNSKYRVTSRVSHEDNDYRSSTELVIRVARWFSLRFIDRELFDIRALGTLYLIIFLLIVYLALLASRPWRLSVRILFAVLIIFVLADASYIAYFDSFYSEPTAIVSLTLALGAGLLLITRQTASWLLLACYFIAAVILITSKPMYAPLALPLGGFGVYLSGLVSSSHRYGLGITLALALCVLGVWYQGQSPQWLRRNANFNGIFLDLLPTSETRTQDLAALGLEPYWERYVGMSPFTANSPLNEPTLRTDFETRINSFTLPRFYLLRPGRFFSLVQRCARHAMTTRLDYLGYYEKNSGKPPQSPPPAPWSAMRDFIFPKNILVLVTFFLVGAAVTIAGAINQPSRRGWFALYGTLLAIAAMQFIIPSLLMGEVDLARYLLLYNLIFDASLVILVVGLFRLGPVRVAKLPIGQYLTRRR